MKLEDYFESLRKRNATASAIKGWSIFVLVFGILMGLATIVCGIVVAIQESNIFGYSNGFFEDNFVIIISSIIAGIIVFLIFWVTSLFLRGFGEIIQNTYATANSAMCQVQCIKEYLDKHEDKEVKTLEDNKVVEPEVSAQ